MTCYKSILHFRLEKQCNILVCPATLENTIFLFLVQIQSSCRDSLPNVDLSVQEFHINSVFFNVLPLLLFLFSFVSDETAKWEKITYLGIATCTVFAFYNLSKGHPHHEETAVNFPFYSYVVTCYL